MPFDDEEVTGTPASNLAKNAVSSNPTVLLTTEDLDVDFGDADAVSMSDGLDKIVPADKKSYARFAPLMDIVKTKMAWMHYLKIGDKTVAIRCLSKRDSKHVLIGAPGLCCKTFANDDEQKAQVAFALLALRYLNADPTDGKYKKDAQGNFPAIRWELGWVKLSRTGFKLIGNMVEEDETGGPVFDIAMSTKTAGFGYDYSRLSRVALFRKNPELLEEVLAAAEKYKDGVLLSKRLGKVITEIDLRALLASKASAAGGGASNDTSDL